MLSYPVRFKTVSDFRNFANMIYRFPVAGYVEEDGFQTSIYRLLDIMSHFDRGNLSLVLTACRDKDVAEVEGYLRDKGLLRTEAGMAA